MVVFEKNVAATPSGFASVVGGVKVVLTHEDYTPPRAGSGSTSTLPKSMSVLLNPESLSYKAGSEWTKLAVPGLSHEVLQWSHSKSIEVSFELAWFYNIAAAQTDNRGSSVTANRALQSLTRYKEFLLAFTVPIARGRAPSRMRVYWPGFMNIVGAVERVDFDFVRFSPSGVPMEYRADIQLTEARTQFRNREQTSFLSDDSALIESILSDQTLIMSDGDNDE